MNAIKSMLRLLLVVCALVPLFAAAAEIHVMMSGGFAAAYRVLVPEFERTSQHKVVTALGPSMGETPEAIPNRLLRGEPADVLIMVGPALDGLIKQGKAVAGTKTDLAQSGIGIVVRAGAPRPDVTSVDAFKRTLLGAKSIAYSDSASGVYLSTVLFPRLGIADQIRDKSRMIPGEPVAAVVARGEAEIGFQQTSELKPITGIDLVGPLPGETQKMTIFSAAIATGATQADAAGALIRFLASPAAAAAITDSGMNLMPMQEKR
jgi:molybdate transport system substrate-binding protein